MPKIPIILFVLATFFTPISVVFSAEIGINVGPENVVQGIPILITVDGKDATVEKVAKIIFAGKSLWFFDFNGKPSAFYGLDLNLSPGQYEILVKMEDGRTFRKNLEVKSRKKYEAPLGIPEKLGGNTPQAATNLVSNLSKENKIINSVFSASKRFWREEFRYPLNKNEITDEYGYSRKTDQYSIAHKGTDFRAGDGESVYAINSGIVRLVMESKIYGKTLAIDHGFGVVSFYMHLSDILVEKGAMIKIGEKIALAGKTGYAENPHLHLSIKINGISIDPIQFLEIMKN